MMERLGHESTGDGLVAALAAMGSATSPSFRANLEARGVPVESWLFPDEGHGWRRLPNRIRSAVMLADFFERRLTA